MNQPELLTAACVELAGADLACWCPLDGGACHRYVLLSLVNQPAG